MNALPVKAGKGSPMKKARTIRCFTALTLVGLVGACSDAVPPSARGAASFHVGTPAMQGASCTSTPHWSNAPFVASTTTMPVVTLSQKGDPQTGLAVNGEGGAGVTCSVKAKGDGKFLVDVHISSPVPNTQANQFTAHIDAFGPTDTTATGTVSVSDAQTLNSFFSSTCAFAARPNTDGIDGVAAGKIWASVTCTNAKDITSADANALCDFTPPAVFVFENCDQ